MIMERIFQASAAILAAAAVYLLWAGRADAGFVAAVAGSVAFFLSIRTQVKERNRIRELERAAAENDAPAE
ncbi:MAG TPA: hypothetical protein DEA22_13365 [Blastocatellia bacterium]|nr:hypothetical protein [Blastocatellia bacterium]